MKVKDFEITRDSSTGFDVNRISILPIQLQDVNLLVGKNASGKTTVRLYLELFSNLFTRSVIYVGNYKISFTDTDGSIYRYEFFGRAAQGGAIETQESLYRNSDQLIKRDNKEATIYSESLKGLETVNPP